MVVQSLEVESPILLTQLDDAEKKPAPVPQSDKAKQAAAATDQRNDSRKLAESFLAARRALSRDESGDKTQDRKSGDQSAPLAKSASATGAKEPQVSARQYAFQLPADALPQTRTRLKTALRAQSQTRLANESRAEQRSMQVLFVVVDQAAAGKPVSPATTPKTSVPAKANAKPTKPQEQDGAA